MVFPEGDYTLIERRREAEAEEANDQEEKPRSRPTINVDMLRSLIQVGWNDNHQPRLYRYNGWLLLDFLCCLFRSATLILYAFVDRCLGGFVLGRREVSISCPALLSACCCGDVSSYIAVSRDYGGWPASVPCSWASLKRVTPYSIIHLFEYIYLTLEYNMIRWSPLCAGMESGCFLCNIIEQIAFKILFMCWNTKRSVIKIYRSDTSSVPRSTDKVSRLPLYCTTAIRNTPWGSSCRQFVSSFMDT